MHALQLSAVKGVQGSLSAQPQKSAHLDEHISGCVDVDALHTTQQ